MEKLKHYYKLLGIRPGATVDEIKRAYLAVEKQFHAERLSEDPVVRHKSQERLRKINEAYLALIDTYQEVQATLCEGMGPVEQEKPAEGAQVIAVAETHADGKVAGVRGDRGITPANGPHPEGVSDGASHAPGEPEEGHVIVAPLPASPAEASGMAGQTDSADTQDAMRSGRDKAENPDPTALVRNETVLLLSVVAVILSVIAISLIGSSLRNPAPTAPAAVSSPAAAASPFKETSGLKVVVQRSPSKHGRAASPPSRKTLEKDSFNAQEVLQDAGQGKDKAQAFLGYLYLSGKGVRQDSMAAAQWFHKAADQGNAEAQNWLGYLYETGTGVPKDYTEAVRWYRLAAEQGNAEGQKNLGLKYLKGKGVTRDGHEGIKWLRKAARQGNAEAQRALEIWQEE